MKLCRNLPRKTARRRIEDPCSSRQASQWRAPLIPLPKGS
jgi:hypothetical protein